MGIPWNGTNGPLTESRPKWYETATSHRRLAAFDDGVVLLPQWGGATAGAGRAQQARLRTPPITKAWANYRAHGRRDGQSRRIPHIAYPDSHLLAHNSHCKPSPHLPSCQQSWGTEHRKQSFMVSSIARPLAESIVFCAQAHLAKTQIKDAMDPG